MFAYLCTVSMNIIFLSHGRRSGDYRLAKWQAAWYTSAKCAATGREPFPPMKTELIEKASRIVGDNQLLINIVSKRVQQLTHGADPFVPTVPEMGLGDIALTEIVEGKLVWREVSEEEGEEGSPGEVADIAAPEQPAPEA